jgi:hypothetical protein
MNSMSSINGLSALYEIIFFNDMGFISVVCNWDWSFEAHIINEVEWEPIFKDANHLVVIIDISCSCCKDIQMLKELSHGLFCSSIGYRF